MTTEQELKLIEMMMQLGLDKQIIMDTVFYTYTCSGSIALGFSHAIIESVKVKCDKLKTDIADLKKQQADESASE